MTQLRTNSHAYPITWEFSKTFKIYIPNITILACDPCVLNEKPPKKSLGAPSTTLKQKLSSRGSSMNINQRCFLLQAIEINRKIQLSKELFDIVSKRSTKQMKRTRVKKCIMNLKATDRKKNFKKFLKKKGVVLILTDEEADFLNKQRMFVKNQK
jgi:hypothetical protein